MLLSIVYWLAYIFFLFGALGGWIYLIRVAHRRVDRVEVHHRYYQTPVYYGPGTRAGDMAQDDPEPDRAA